MEITWRDHSARLTQRRCRHACHAQRRSGNRHDGTERLAGGVAACRLRAVAEAFPHRKRSIPLVFSELHGPPRRWGARKEQAIARDVDRYSPMVTRDEGLPDEQSSRSPLEIGAGPRVLDRERRRSAKGCQDAL
jgi:hypothetical protein